MWYISIFLFISRAEITTVCPPPFFLTIQVAYKMANLWILVLETLRPLRKDGEGHVAWLVEMCHQDLQIKLLQSNDVPVELD